MKAMEQMTLPELHRECDNSLFSEIAWMPSQIMFRESIRGFIKNHTLDKLCRKLEQVTKINKSYWMEGL